MEALPFGSPSIAASTIIIKGSLFVKDFFKNLSVFYFGENHLLSIEFLHSSPEHTFFLHTHKASCVY